MILSSIVAMGKNRVIGKDNVMMWSIPSETEHYRNFVHGHYYILGRKNFEGSPKSHIDRLPIILTRQENYLSDTPFFSDFKQACSFAKEKGESELFILGGADIYQLAMPFISRLYLSIVDYDQPGDVYFPAHEDYDWKVVEEKSFPIDERTPLSWSFQLLEKSPEPLES
jgi:dihydrofolate reductase